MRILTIFGICLLIVTLAVGVDARERSSKERSSSSASSRDSGSSSDRHSSGSNDRQSSSSSNTSYRPSSSSSSQSSRTASPAYGPSNTPTRTEVKPVSSDSNRAYSAYRPSNGTSSTVTTSSSSSRSAPTAPAANNGTRSDRTLYSAYKPDRNDNKADSTRITATTGYRPSNDTVKRPETRQDTKTTASSDGRGTHDVYSASRPSSSNRSTATAPAVNNGTPSGRTIYTAYNPDRTNNKPDSTRSTATTGYRPSNDSVKKPDTRQGDQGRDHSTYKPSTGSNQTTSNFPSTQSIRDRKIAATRTPGATSYKPTVDKRHFTYANYQQPKSYKPPSYRSGYYYYSNPRYVTRPCTYGFWSFDYYPSYSRRSLYFHYGMFPYIAVTRIIVSSYPTVVYVGEPIYTIYGDRYEYSRYPGLDDTLADIRSTWVSGRIDLLDRHVRDSYDIAVLLDGRYDYSVTPYDYVEMTEDAVGGMDTVSFVWTKVQARRDGNITAFATHTYRSGGYARKVYVNYTLQRVGGSYFICEVGSAQTPWN